jgi:hypothetical protein
MLKVEEASAITLDKKKLDTIIGHSHCYCKVCNAVAHQHWEPIFDGEPQSLSAQSRNEKRAAEMYHLLWDLNQILPTALHNGHHDLIQRVKEIVGTR